MFLSRHSVPVCLVPKKVSWFRHKNSYLETDFASNVCYVEPLITHKETSQVWAQ